jgi:hypothetical protein
MQGAPICRCLLARPALFTSNPPPPRSRSGDQSGHLAPGSPPPFTMLETDSPAVEGASLAPRDIGPSWIRTKIRAQHVAAALSGSSSSSIKCVVDSTLQYTTPNDTSLQVQDPPPPSPAFWPVDHQVSVIPALLLPAIGLQINNQHPVPAVGDHKSCRSANNPYVDPPVH